MPENAAMPSLTYILGVTVVSKFHRFTSSKGEAVR
jgi:hypothetical protein